MNPYEKWLGISIGDRSPDFFQLLGISREEFDPETIKAAAVLQTRKLQKHQDGPHAETCTKLIARVKKAYQVLSNPELRETYVRRLEESKQAIESVPDAKDSPAPRNEQVAGAERTAIGESESKRNVSIPIVAAAGVGLVAIVGAVLFFVNRQPDGKVASTVLQPASSTPSLANQNSGNAGQDSVMTEDTTEAATDESSVSYTAEPNSESGEPDPSIAEKLPTSTEVLPPGPSNDLATMNSGNVDRDDSKSIDTEVAIHVASDVADPTTGESTTSVKPSTVVPNPGLDQRVGRSATSGAQLTSHQARDVLQKNCSRCHGENETDEGGFGYVLDREKLISSGYVRPRDPNQSLLLERMLSNETPMPPQGELPRPSAEEVKIVRDWIGEGADAFEETKTMPFMGTAAKYRLIATDLERLDKRDRPFVRYFAIDHLANAGYSAEELGVYKRALAKLVNSLSWNRKLAGLSTVGVNQSLFRIDLRDLKWSRDSWSTIIARYPYGVIVDSVEASYVRKETDCDVPIIRADWFVSSASRPPLYHTLAQIPTTDRKLEEYLRVDVTKNIDQGRVLRLGFARSGVSQHNRLIERHESIFGAYWKSYDFAGSTGRKNLFENPLGPGAVAGTFAHDGGEIIFQLPNGMLAYMLTDQLGNRIDKGPTNIVSDPRQPDRAVVNGVSCMSCHHGGLIQKTDEIRNHVEANQAAYSRHQDILALYSNKTTAEKAIEADTKRYLTALGSDEIGMPNPTRAGEPIVLVSNRYLNEIDLTLAAAEFGLPRDGFAKEIDSIAVADLSRKVGVWKTTGGVVKRETFEQEFGRLVRELDLGNAIAVKLPPAGAKPPAVAVEPILPRLTNLPFGTNPAAADAALSAALRAFDSRDWKKSEPLFEQAIRLAVSPGSRLRACEQAIPMFERLERVEPLVDVHKMILDACSNALEIEKARNNLFASLVRFTQKPTSWSRATISRRGTAGRSTINRVDWSVKFPTSVSNAIATTFERQLQKTPDHEATLKVLQTYYQRVHDRPDKRREVLVRLNEIYKKRGERLDADSEIDLAALLAQSGENAQAAEIYSRIGNQFAGLRASAFFLLEAKSLIAVKDTPKAILALNKSYKQCLRDQGTTTSFQLTQIGDAYLTVDQEKEAAECYKRALRFEKNTSQLQIIQAKLANLVDAARPASAATDESESMDELLDPRRRFRLEAQNLESRVTSNASSIFMYMTQAAEAWIKAEDNERAYKALKKAAAAQRRTASSGRLRSHAQLADLFRQIEHHQEALDQYLRALKLATNASEIEKYQIEIVSLTENDPNLTIKDADSALMDPNYKYRSQARQYEKQQSYNADSKASSLTRACEYWGRAGDKEEVLRCGLLAESSIGKIVSDSPYPPQERHYASLAKIYVAAELHEPAVRCFIAAMTFAHRDDQAVQYHQQAKEIAEQNGLTLPKLSQETAAKLDPA